MDFLTIYLTTWAISGIPISALVIMLTNILKELFPKSWSKILPFIVGIILSLLSFGLSFPNVFGGIILGALATGGYRLIKPLK